MSKYLHRFRIESSRLRKWDYSWDGIYFITICTNRRAHYFGTVRSSRMIYTEIGAIARKYWLEIPSHFPFGILDEFVIMPNHVHGIIRIDHPDNKSFNGTIHERITGNTEPRSVFTAIDREPAAGGVAIVETQNFASLQYGRYAAGNNGRNGPYAAGYDDRDVTDGDGCLNRFGPQSQNLPSIIRGYKSGVKKYATMHHIEFAWQPRYYESIVSDQTSLNRIRQYIRNNPQKWGKKT